MSGIDAEKLNIILAARDREFAKAMDRNTRRVERFTRQSNKNLSSTSRRIALMGSAAKLAGAAIAGLTAAAVIAKVRRTIAALDDIGKTADRIGLTTDALQELRTVAESSGVAQSELDTAMEKFSKGLGEAKLGIGQARIALDAMGLSADNLADMPLDQALGRVADQMAMIADPTERTALAMQLFGRSGSGMLNLLREGAGGIAKMREDARALGIVIDEKLIRNAEEAQTKLDLMARVVSANLSSALIELAPILTGAAEGVAVLAGGVGRLVDYIRELREEQARLVEVEAQLAAARRAGFESDGGDSDLLVAQAGAAEGLEAAYSSLAGQADVLSQSLRDQAQTLYDLGFVDEAIYVREYAENIDLLNSRMRSGEGTLQDYADRLGDILTSAQQTIAPLEGVAGVNFDPLNGALSGVAGTLERVRDWANRARAAITAIPGTSGGGDPVVYGNMPDPPTLYSPQAPGASVRPQTRPDDIDFGFPDPVTSGGGGGGGGTAGTSRQIAQGRELADVLQLVDDALTDSGINGANYRETIAAINELHQGGTFTAEEFQDGLGGIEEHFRDTAQAAERMERAATDALVSIFNRSNSAADAVSNLLGQLGSMALNAAFQPVLKGAFGGLASIFTGESFEGGGGTGNAPRVGGLDGKGGRMVMIHPQETVIDHKQAGSVAPARNSTGPNVNVNIMGATGNSEIIALVQAGIRQGLQGYDRNVLPSSTRRINGAPRRIA